MLICVISYIPKVSWSDVVTLNISAGYMKECHSSIAVTSSQDICLSTVDKIRIYARVPLSVDSVNPPIDERFVLRPKFVTPFHNIYTIKMFELTNINYYLLNDLPYIEFAN